MIMSRSYSQVMDRARSILQDADKTRYTDDDLLGAVNDGLIEIRRIRPDLLLSVAFVTDEKAIGDIADNLPVEDFAFQSLVYMAAGYMMLRDDEYSLDSRAVNMLNIGTSKLLRTLS